ncbi:MAG: DUF5367 family protein [Alphaproteobacteria bacterium]
MPDTLAVLYGLFLWAAATLGAWLGGAALFSGGLASLIIFALAVPAVRVLLRAFWRLTITPPEDRLRTGLLIALPGLFANAGLLLVAPAMFGWPSPVAPIFASWLLWVYGLALVFSIRAAPGADQPNMPASQNS